MGRLPRERVCPLLYTQPAAAEALPGLNRQPAAVAETAEASSNFIRPSAVPVSAARAVAPLTAVAENLDISMEDLPPTQAVPLLEGLTFFVEVRAGRDNWTRGIQTSLRRLGANISEKVMRHVTHVIFRDGTRANFQKAKKLGLTILSLL
jgi:hypothetical protein